jgi:glyoxylase-like metal-dependent hydrolase (beta-lactamase superfamily II)
MSARLVRELGCRFVMHERAARSVPRYNDTPGYIERLVRIGNSHGVPARLLDSVTADLATRPGYMPMIEPPDHTVVDGDTIDLGGGRWLEVIHTPGHEPAHICLRDSRTGVFFSGDHVLPRISPVVMWDEDLDDPLGDYLASLGKLLGLDIGVAYPAHGTLIDRGDERARQILLHHDRRLLDMAELVRSRDSTAWDVMVRSFRPNLTPIEARLAFLETVSHLQHLAITGRLHAEPRGGKVVFRR